MSFEFILVLEYFYFLFNTIFKALYFAQLPRIHNVLDVGTGTGLWAEDFGISEPVSAMIFYP